MQRVNSMLLYLQFFYLALILFHFHIVIGLRAIMLMEVNMHPELLKL